MTHVEDNTHAGQGAVLLDIGGSVGALAAPSHLLHDHHHPHVGVVDRPRDGRHGDAVPSAVFGELEEGEYELYVRPDGPVTLVAAVAGGAVKFESWPGV